MKNKAVMFLLLVNLLCTTLFYVPNGTFAEEQIFKDVPVNHWIYDETKYLKEKGVITGYSDNTFRPDNYLRRDHLALILAKSLKLKKVKPFKQFSDVPKDYPYFEAISLVQQAGIMDGTNGLFRPKEYVTRAQLSKVITKAFGLEGGKIKLFLKDVSEEHWAYEYIRTLAINRIFWTNDYHYKPNNNATRADFASFMYRALTNTKYSRKGLTSTLIDNNCVFERELMPSYIRNAINNHPSIFDTSIAYDTVLGGENNKFVLKILENGLESVEDTSLKFYDSIDFSLSLISPTYNPTYQTNMISELDYYDFSGSTYIVRDPLEGFQYKVAFQIVFDFRSKDATKVAADWLVVSDERLKSIVPKLYERIEEANKEWEKNGTRGFLGRGLIEYIDPYRIHIGVNPYMENMWIEVIIPLKE
ncbi:S-layer homology domain-containing protein [Parageobacillus thermoglucosidasius]|uniref:SLH domain-containing protein n=1 Tax=Parageobacillus thermoglucosidasius TaxID=1426 RepID=A0A1B7KWP0_PARTM|nr:S-layer homology domain-containing protein [Parageobacillus thermoglucosidasius]OAT74549.1 hypothetical protein A7K69_02240 [Parageobacillus thermoglucosidasius]